MNTNGGNIIVSIILIMAVTVMGLGLLSYSLLHERVVRARSRRMAAYEKMYQETILQIHRFHEKAFGESLARYEKPEEDFFSGEHFPEVTFHGHTFTHRFSYEKFDKEEYQIIRIFNDFRTRSQRMSHGLDTGICLSLLCGRIPVTMIPLIVDNRIVEQKQAGDTNGSGHYYRDSVAVELEIINFLLDSLDLAGTDFDWNSLRIRLGLEPGDHPPETGIYFICLEGIIKSIFVQGDVEEMVFSGDSDVQEIAITQQGIVYRLRYGPGTHYFSSWNDNLGGSEIFDERIIVNGDVSMICQEGKWAFSKDTALSLFVSGRLVLSRKLVGVPVHGEKFWNHLLIINSSRALNGLQDSLAVIDEGDDPEDVQMDVSLVIEGKLINRRNDTVIRGSVYCSGLDDEGSLKVSGTSNRSSGGRFFHTGEMKLLQDFFVDYIEEHFGE